MAEPLSNPHDRFFKDLFSRQEIARDFLHHYLPTDIIPLLDLTALEISKDSFIDPDLQEHFSDLLYKVALQAGNEAYIYVLFEHKSYPDPLIAFQLLRYMVRIWEQNLKQRQPLLPIVPLVIYHGRSGWTVALNFTALLEVPEALKPYVPEYQYWLCDLSRYSDADIRGEVILRVGLLLLKYMVRDDLRQHVSQIFGLLRQLSQRETGLEYLETVLRYVAGGTEQLTEEELRQVVQEVLAEGERLMPTIAEQWIEQGRQEGLEQGLERGRETALNLLRRFLVRRFEVALDRFDQELQGLTLEAIEQLSEAAFEAESLAEFEAALAQMAPPKDNHE
jgi:predicted transposase/invertase (TIGR01784 family)